MQIIAKLVGIQIYSRSDTGITADEVFEGGSLGGGTTVPSMFDIDLVIYSRSK